MNGNVRPTVSWISWSFCPPSEHSLPCWRSIDATSQSSPIIFEDSWQFRVSCLAMVAYDPPYRTQERRFSELAAKSKQRLQVRVSFGVKSYSFKAGQNLCGHRIKNRGVRQRFSSVSLSAFALKQTNKKIEWNSVWIRAGSAQVNIIPSWCAERNEVRSSSREQVVLVDARLSDRIWVTGWCHQAGRRHSPNGGRKKKKKKTSTQLGLTMAGGAWMEATCWNRQKHFYLDKTTYTYTASKVRSSF